MKKVVAVSPYIHQGINFKNGAYTAWETNGGQVAKPYYPWRPLHGLAFRWELPSLWINKNEARLRFVQPVSIKFDAFPDYARYEIIPFIWDCWPAYFESTCAWLKRHKVRTAIFTSSQIAKRMQALNPNMNILFVPEGINTDIYPEGNSLHNRNNKLYEIGSGRRCYLKSNYPKEYERISNLPVEGLVKNKQDYIKALCNAKITVTFPRCDLMPEETGGIETLTQRYWESMLTRSVIIGRAPKELIELIGYNPVIDMDKFDPIGQIEDILAHIGDYQSLVDKNRRTALENGSWEKRMIEVAQWLYSCGYDCFIKD